MPQIRTFQDCFPLYTPNWCGTCYVDQNVIVLTETQLEISVSRMLRLKAYTNIYIIYLMTLIEKGMGPKHIFLLLTEQCRARTHQSIAQPFHFPLFHGSQPALPCAAF